MTERKLLFLMNAEQATEFVRLVKAAEAGDGSAACRLGDLYREGAGGLRYSPKETFRWYSRSALAGNDNGQNNLGACYEHGLGCRQSYARAVKWYRLAAARQVGTASMNLGYCYLYGHGVPLDKIEALRLFRLAVKQGEPKAREELERLGEPVEEPGTGTRVHFKDVTEHGVHVGIVGVQAGQSPPEAARPPALRKNHVLANESSDFEGVTDPAVKAAMKDDCFDLPPEGSLARQRLLEKGRRMLEMARRNRAERDQQLAAASTPAGSTETPRADEAPATDAPSALHLPEPDVDRAS